MTRPGLALFVITTLTILLAQEVSAARIKRFLYDQQPNTKAIDTGPYQWTRWSSWSHCDATCEVNGGMGQQSRKRHCDDGDGYVELRYCREPYTGDSDDEMNAFKGYVDIDADTIIEDGSTQNTKVYEYKSCAHANCPVNGGWSNWSNFGVCSVTSGNGHMTRHRLCNNPTPVHGGHDCIGFSNESKACTVNTWSVWEGWTSCSVTCGTGNRMRSRHCTTGTDCIGVTNEAEICTEPSCIINGGWSAWTEFGKCSRSCGTGVTFRTRLCNNPTPKNGGLNCTGNAQELKACFKVNCPIDGGWSDFKNLSCSTTCGIGVMTSIRTCTNPAPSYGGKNCSGAAYSFKHCNLRNCVVNKWSDWSAWSACDTTCNNGSRSRTRSCLSENDCIGESSQTEACNASPCPIDGGWSKFRNVSCSVTCGVGQEIALRECNNPAPQFGGKDCVGLSHQITVCEMPSCTTDGSWSEWSNFSQCGSICGEGYSTRNRTCSNPTPQNGGQNCTGSHEQTVTCNSGPCPLDVPVCNKVTVLEVVQSHALFAPTRAAPCSNMDFIPEENMLKDLCGAPADATTWSSSLSIANDCNKIPLYSPIMKLHRTYTTRNYGILLDCENSKMKIATETCADGVHEQFIDLEIVDDWEYFTMKWK